MKLVQLGILATFLLSWFSAANGAILCQCEDGYLSVENFYTGPCEHDSEHHNEEHSDISCDCDDVPYSISVDNSIDKADNAFNFTEIDSIIKTNTIIGSRFLERDYTSYVLKERRIALGDIHHLETIILII